MKAKLTSLDDFEAKSHESDCAWILKEIKGITYRFEGQRYIYLSLDDARTTYYAYTQGAKDSISSYLEHFCSLVEVLEHYGGAIGKDPGLLDATAAVSADADDATKRLKIARDRTLALAFLKRADCCCFGTLWADLENQFSQGNDQYPTNLTAAYSLLVNFKPPKRDKPRRNLRSQERAVEEEDGMTFVQASEVIAGADGVTHTHVTCFRCEHKGHYANKCPNGPNATLLQTEAATAVTLLQASHTEAIVAADNTNQEVSHFTFAQLPSRHELIPSSWVLLNSQSTVSVFKNPNFLTNIRRSNSQLKVHTNGGTQILLLVGDIKNFGTVWYNPDSLANIFSLAAVRMLCRITMDTSVEASLCVYRSDGSIMKFIEYRSGLYYHNAAAAVQSNSNENVIDYSFVSTVANKKAQFPRREIEGADKARVLYRKIGRPSQQQFEQNLAMNLIRNCPVTVDDHAKRALLIYGPDVAALKGKTTKGSSQHVPTFNPVQVPGFILQHHSDVTLCMDIFYVQGHPFFHTISRKAQFRTVPPVLNRNKATLLREIKPVLAMYKVQGFQHL